MPLLEVNDLRTYISTRRGLNKAVDGVSFSLDSGKTLGLVGESGSGKSMTALSILRLVPQPVGRIVGGSVRFNGEELLNKSEEEMRQLRGGEISIVLQDPLTSLNPLFSIGFQVGEAVGLHQGLSGRARLDEVIQSLQRVRVAAAETRVNDYPHQFSGGMRQRVVGAIAIACKSKLLIADEATTALDATIQAQYLALLRELQQDLDLAILFITHDFGIVAKMCDHVAVMYAGGIVEYADVRQSFNRPSHPYTQALLEAVPKVDSRVSRLFAIPGVPATGFTHFTGCPFASRCPVALDKCHDERPPVIEVAPGHISLCWRAEEVYRAQHNRNGAQGRAKGAQALSPVQPARPAKPLITVEDLKVYFPVRRGPFFNRKTVMLKAVDGVSFILRQGETFSLVGESGCGKTTTARAILKIEDSTGGRVLWSPVGFSSPFMGGGQGKGKPSLAAPSDIQTLSPPEERAYRTAVQAVFQDPYSSMNPRMRVGDFVSEPLLLNPDLGASQRRGRAEEVLQQVGLRAEDVHLFPHQFSGGQRQRIAIARALASSPQLIVLDEPVSSLDVSIRAQIMNLLKELQERLGLSYLFIAHHLGTVRYMSDSVGVMYLGRLAEMGPSEEVFSNPLHPYTRALLSAALPDHPDVKREEVLLQGDVAAPTAVPSGCRLHPRCPFARAECSTIDPPWKEISPGHWAACHLY